MGRGKGGEDVHVCWWASLCHFPEPVKGLERLVGAQACYALVTFDLDSDKF